MTREDLDATENIRVDITYYYDLVTVINMSYEKNRKKTVELIISVVERMNG